MSNQPSKFWKKNCVEINDDRSSAYDKKIFGLKPQGLMQVYVIIVMHIYLLKEQKLPLEKEQMVQYFEISKK